MCEILLRVHDSALAGDPVVDSKASRRGDVIVVCPDGWGWGKEELTNPFWRILRFPGVPESEASILAAPEVADTPIPGRTLQFRMYGLNLEHPFISNKILEYLSDDTRTQATYTLLVPFRALIKRKPVISDPAEM